MKDPDGLVSADAAARLLNTPELDYCTHIVMRLFENKRCATRAVSCDGLDQAFTQHAQCGLNLACRLRAATYDCVRFNIAGVAPTKFHFSSCV